MVHRQLRSGVRTRPVIETVTKVENRDGSNQTRASPLEQRRDVLITLPKERRALFSLYKSLENIISILDLDQLLEEVMDISIDILEADRGMIFLDDEETGELTFRFGRDIDAESMQDAYRYSTTVLKQADREVVFVPDVEVDDNLSGRESIRRFKIQSIMCSPLTIGGKIRGVLYLDSHSRIEDEDGGKRQLLTAFTNLAARVIENRKLYRQLQATREQLEEENLTLKSAMRQKYSFDGIIGDSGRMQEVFSLVSRVAPGRANVIIFGESGTGKELIARAIHYGSPRKDGPFIDISCPSVPRDLIESEFFGHEKGAFTGADRMRRGKFELADGGTLFLDEVADTDLSTQVKLLRAIQERNFMRVGGEKKVEVDVRIISATSKDLSNLVKEGSFREDLYYRLNVVPVVLPPLRERREDIPALVEHFILKYARECEKRIESISPPALAKFVSFNWPGNVRQLENAVEYAVNIVGREKIDTADLPMYLKSVEEGRQEHEPLLDGTLSLDQQVRSFESALIRGALDLKGGNQSAAARLLGITETRIRSKIKKLNLPN